MSASTERKNRIAAREAGTDKKMLAQKEEAEKKAKSKRKWTLGTIGVLLLIALIILLDSPFLYRVTTAVTIGDQDYSPADVDYYYISQFYSFYETYGSYASYLGLDLSNGLADLRNQPCGMMEEGSWRDYFIDAAYNRIKMVQAGVDYADRNGIVLDADELAGIEDQIADLSESAKTYGYGSVKKYLAANYGEGVTVNTIRKAAANEILAAKASEAYEASLNYSADDLAEEYAGFNGIYDLFNYSVYTVEAETAESTDADGNDTSAPTEETLAEARKTAAFIYSEYRKLGDEKAVFERLNEAAGSVVDGAEAVDYTNVLGANVGEYAEWLMDDARAAGDVYLSENAAGTGYYIIAFASRDYNDYPMRQVRHILVKAVAAEDGTYSDVAKNDALVKAENILAEFNAGDKTEDSFALLAEQYTEDVGSASNGGLYDAVAKGVMVKGFEDFCFADHQYGDTDIVYGESGSYAGYHVMFYVGEGEDYCDYLAENSLKNEAVSEWINDLQKDLTVTEGYGRRFVA